MISPISAYNRLAVVFLPAITFVAFCSAIMIIVRDVMPFSDVKKFFLLCMRMPFPVVGLIGICMGLLDWFFPKNKKLRITAMASGSLLAVGFGCWLASLILKGG
jgi:hypothetical protein